jgi:hypothetical protein
MVRKNFLVLLLAFAFVVVACGDDDSSSDDGGDEPQSETTEGGESETDDAASDESDSSDVSAGGASSVTLDGEEIALDALGCYSEEQEVAGSIITLTAQASGTNAAGENVIVDFTRFAPGGTVSESDDMLIDIGPLGESTNYRANLPYNSVEVVDGVLTVSETTFTSFGDDGTQVEATASVAIVC